MRTSARLAARLAAMGSLWAAAAAGQAADAGVVPADAATVPSDAGAPAGDAAKEPSDAAADADVPSATPATCTESIPKGKQRPKVSEKFPETGQSGYAAFLELTIEHGRGERVLQAGFNLQKDTAEFKAVKAAHFMFPEPEGGAAPSVTSEDTETGKRSVVKIPFVPLPPEPGRHTLTLPPVPIALSRASGEVVRLCTAAHEIVVEDPIANLVDPKPKDNPTARRQVEHWSTLKHVTYAGLAALLAGVLIAWLVGKWLKRPKPAPPPAPPRPPWDVALEKLFDIRNAKLISSQRFDEHFDRVSDTVREYLGGRYGFDGLESTTREMLTALRKQSPSISVLSQIEAFLRKADLVKFARMTPTEVECEQALNLAEELVHRTMPRREDSVEPPGASGQSSGRDSLSPASADVQAKDDAGGKAP